MAHTFLWMAHLVGAKMIPHHYVILDSEPSGSTAQKKPRKKTKEHKGKGKVVSAVAGSGNKSDDTTGKMITWQKKVTWEADGLTLSASNCRSENPVHGAAKGVANSKSLEYGNEEMVVDWPTLYKQEAEQKHQISKKVIKSVIDAEDMEESGGGDNQSHQQGSCSLPIQVHQCQQGHQCQWASPGFLALPQHPQQPLHEQASPIHW